MQFFLKRFYFSSPGLGCPNAFGDPKKSPTGHLGPLLEPKNPPAEIDNVNFWDGEM